MTAEHFKFIFSCPEYKISVNKVKVFFDCKTMLFYTYSPFIVDEKYIKFGNILNPTKNIVFYEVTFIGENNYNLARKYFLKLLKRESVHSDQHRIRYEKYKNQVEKEKKNENL